MDIESVFAAVVNERVHQDAKWGTVKDHPHEVAGWISLMEMYLLKAKQAWCRHRDNTFALDEVRKVVALGFACLEQHLPEGYLPDPDVPTVACPLCNTEREDRDGLGAVACPTCKWCTHPASSRHGEGPMACDVCGAVTGE